MTPSDQIPIAGFMEILEHGIRRILAPNPSPMTFHGTNTYIVGSGAVAVIDPGPANEDHLDAILSGLNPGEQVSHILVTHSHLDHSPLAAPLSRATGAAIHAFGHSSAGRNPVMNELAKAGLTGGGEGVDSDFAPDEILPDGARIVGRDWQLTALWTPGHFGNHMCFATDDAVFSGDLVMGWASTMVSPPDGDLSAFMASATRLADWPARVFYPGHGAAITDPGARTRWLIEHRMEREASILAALGTSRQTVRSLTHSIYTDVAPALLGAASRNVFAHLIDLHQKNMVRADPHLSLSAEFYKA